MDAPGGSPLALEALIAGIQWQRSTNGDSEVDDKDWSDWPTEWLMEVEAAFQKWLLDTHSKEATDGAGSRLRRCTVGIDQTSDCKTFLPWTRNTKYSVDFHLMTCMEQAPSDSRARVLPLRRLEEGHLTHPPPGKPHPWYLKRVEARDSADGFNNDFFFKAFIKAMNDAGHAVQGDANAMFDFRYNQDFRGKSEAEPAIRGGVMYEEPIGWKKFATRVRGLFDGGNNSWLCLDGRDGEWAIAYHGTNFATMPGILNDGMHVGERQAYKDFKDARTGEKIGTGIYCTPKVKTAAEYSPVVEVDGRKVQFVFQCRVRPQAIKRIHEEVGRESGAYWLINDPADIRPYGVLVREAEA